MEHTCIVTGPELERQLTLVCAASKDPRAGVFGPGSVSWRIDREAAIFLGSGPALLLQLAHPWVAAAITQHSRALDDPIGRFHRTFGIVHAMVFGSLDQALAAARQLHRRHAAVRGRMYESVGPFAAGSEYRADDVAALRWVHATLVDTALRVHEGVFGPLGIADRERYWTESRLFAALFGIPGELLPADWNGFTSYMAEMQRSSVLTVSRDARTIVGRLIGGQGRWPGAPVWYDALTAHLLPEPLRDGFGLRYGPAEQRRAERVLARAGAICPRLPHSLRFVGPYQEARARLEGATRPSLGVQLLNRVWIGRPALEE